MLLVAVALVALASCDSREVFVPIIGDGQGRTGDSGSDGEMLTDSDVAPSTDAADTSPDASDGGDVGPESDPVDVDATDTVDDDADTVDDDADTVDDDADTVDDGADIPADVGGSCGDGELTDGEICDDGDRDDGDGCASDCTLEPGFVNVCGDGVAVSVAGEECDRGADNDDEAPDACRTDCRLAACGDGVRDTGEACDLGDASGPCDADCRLIDSCGDGVPQAPEECDDGNDDPSDGCDACTLTGEAICGDGLWTPASGEECDGDDTPCGGDEFCDEACLCGSYECGDDFVDPGEECDGVADEACGDGAGCGETCVCVPFDCGNDTLDPSEECDGIDDGACGADEFCDEACRCAGYECGDGVADPGEECDGIDDAACGGEARCDDTCMCVTYFCGDGVADPGERCDGGDDGACALGEVCDELCRCVEEPPAGPTLDPFPADPFGGSSPAVILAPNSSDDSCTEETEPHGYTWRLTGTSEGRIDSYDVQIIGVDSAPRMFTVTPTSPGRFTLVDRVCLSGYAEDTNFRFRVYDSEGRVSNAVNLRIPIREAATLTTLTAAPARDPNLHILRLTGSAPSQNLETLRVDIFAGTTLIAEELDLSLVGIRARYSPAGGYVAVLMLSGVDGAAITSYDGRVLTFGGLESASRTGLAAPDVSGLSDPCVPVLDVWAPSCADGLVCRASGEEMSGTCTNPSGSAPVLTSVVDGRVEIGSDLCSSDFPDALLWTMVGTASEAVTFASFQADEFGVDAFEFGIEPEPPGTFRVETGLCISGLPPTTVNVRAIDEAGRPSEIRSFSP